MYLATKQWNSILSNKSMEFPRHDDIREKCCSTCGEVTSVSRSSSSKMPASTSWQMASTSLWMSRALGFSVNPDMMRFTTIWRLFRRISNRRQSSEETKNEYRKNVSSIKKWKWRWFTYNKNLPIDLQGVSPDATAWMNNNLLLTSRVSRFWNSMRW